MSPATALGRLLRIARSALTTSSSGRGGRRTSEPAPRRGRTPDRRSSRDGRPAPGAPPGRPYPGDYTGVVRPVYRPDLDGDPDPGEIVWAWVPFEEDPTRGKDRPVLVVGHDGPWLLTLMLSTRDHDGGGGRPGERWMDLGSGDWDAKRRESEIRLDRVLRTDPAHVRREGAVLDRERFAAVAGSLGEQPGW